MDGDKIFMSQRQLQRYHTLRLVASGQITLRQAAETIGVSYRHAKRIRKKVQEKGAKGLIHGNTGRHPQNGISAEVKKNVLELSRKVYPGFNDRHFWEKLVENEQIAIGRETVRKIRREAGIAPKGKHRSPRHRRRRERMAQPGAMVLWDGSPHRWFGPDQPPCCLMLAMDDATGEVLAARFFPFEGSAGYLWLLRQMADRYGLPLSIYQDCHGSLKRNDDHWTVEEELRGRQEPTQVGFALEALGIRPIFALSPQAKGRIERLFRTLQDRLAAEMKAARISTLAEANHFLAAFLPRFNRQFGVAPKQWEKAWRPVSNHLDLDRWISFLYPTTVGLDNAVRLAGKAFDIPPGPNRKSYAKAKVEVRQLLDGSWRIYHRDQLIAKHPSTELQENLRALQRRRKTINGAQSYDWVFQASTPIPSNGQSGGHLSLGIKGTY